MQERILDNTYRLLEEIGRGGFGAVYRGVRIGAEGSGQVAIKLLNRNPSLASDEYIRFQREATVMSQLVHPGIVTVYELSEDAGSYFIVMEFIAGPNLREFVRQRGGKLPLVDVIGVLLQVAEALEYVHSHEIVHRDIKPQNVLVQEIRDRGESRIQVKLVDFGVARISAGGAAQVREGAVGTYAYMAPEATGLTEWPLDRRADIYSLGIVAYELLAGKTPFHDCRNEDILRAHVEREPASIKSLRGQEVPATLERVVRKCIAKNPAERYQSTFALVCDLKRMLSDLKSKGSIDEFEVARKDIGMGRMLERAFVGRDVVVCEVTDFLEASVQRNQVVWGMVRSGIGLGKTRCLTEIRREIELRKWRHLYVRFSETEQRLPFQSLSLAINDFLAAYHRQNRGTFKKFVGGIARELGPMVDELGRLIPALRQYAMHSSIEPSNESPQDAEREGDDQGEANEVFTIGDAIDRRYVAPNQRINDAFLVLLEKLVGGGDRLIFLMDDLHLADTSTLSLLLYLLEQKAEDFAFSFVFTMRDKSGRTNLILENFVKRVSMAEKTFRLWPLLPFDRNETSEFFRVIGMLRPDPRFLDFMLEKSNGSALQLNALVKEMLAQDILVPTSEHGTRKSQIWNLEVDWEKLESFVVDHVNIEMLVASLDGIDKRELALMKIAAVCADACEFEYFRIEQDYSHLELETRLLNLVRKGIFEIIGDEHAPIQRRAFVFTHEKIRTAIIARMDNDTRRQLHVALASRIEALYRNPRKEQILSLAKHYEGAGEKASPQAAVRAFLRAAKIYVASNEQRSAEQLLRGAKEAAKRITSQRERLQRLREYYEVEYSFQEAQGNLVEASEVCRNLLEITYDEEKKEVLQIFYAKLLLGLGRHQHAYRQSWVVLDGRGMSSTGQLWSVLAWLNLFLLGTIWHKQYVRILRALFPRVQKQVREPHLQAILIMALTHFHGGQPRLAQTLLLGGRHSLYLVGIERWNVTFCILHAALLLRAGKVQQAYKLYEDCEQYLQIHGLNSLRRWAVALRSLWLDYPMGRMERLLALVDNEAGALLPTSGIMHFESYGMRAWVMLLSPSCRAARSAAGNEVRRRRRSDRGIQAGEMLLENNSARRILDSGENSQYTALALFSDAIRFALSDKIEPLRRATEQLRRQQSVSAVGDAFSLFAFSFQALVLGHQHESLKIYLRAMQKLVAAELEVVSLVVSDALRLASLLLPLMAVSFQARGWPWGEQLCNALRLIDAAFLKAEGVDNPRRNPMTPLFRGFLAFLEGQRRESFILLEHAIKEARTQRCDLIECIALSILGSFSGRMRLSRAAEHFQSALKVARAHDLRLMERQVLGMARLVGVDVAIPSQFAEDSASLTGASREKQTTLGLNEIVFKMQKLHASSSIEELLSETTRIVMSALHAASGVAFLLENEGGRERFVAKVFEGKASREDFDDRWIVKLLPRSGEDPVRILPMDEEDCRREGTGVTLAPPDTYAGRRLDEEERTVELGAGRSSDETVQNGASSEATTAAEEATMAEAPTADAPTADATVAEGSSAGEENTAAGFEATAAGDVGAVRSVPRRRAGTENRYLVLLAITSNRSLMGWIAIPGVLSSSYSSRDVEHDLVLLGLHVGHILSRVYSREGIEASQQVEESAAASQVASDKLREIVDGDLPKELIIEALGKVVLGTQTGWRLYRLKPKRILMVQWKVAAKVQSRARHFGELLGRHMRFFAYSLRQSSEIGQMENMVIKLSSDITTILESAAKEGRFDSLGINVLILDCDEKRAVEADFGGEAYSFSGVSEVEREHLQEIQGILTSDRLVYHERVRRLLGSGGWLFSPSERTEGLFANFAQVDFLEQYFSLRSKKGQSLAKTLGIDRHEPVSALGIFMREKGDGEPE